METNETKNSDSRNVEGPQEATEDKTSIENSQPKSLVAEASEDKSSAENLNSERQQKAKSKLLQLIRSELCT